MPAANSMLGTDIRLTDVGRRLTLAAATFRHCSGLRIGTAGSGAAIGEP
jgi:hypothetical protein